MLEPYDGKPSRTVLRRESGSNPTNLAGILNRVKEINNRASNGTRDDLTAISSEIHEFIEKWQSLVAECAATEGHPLLYFGRRFMVKSPSSEEHRLLKQYNSSGHDSALNTLTSMRNVDTPVLGQVVVWEDN